VAIKGANGRRLLAAHFWFFPGEPLAPGWLYATMLREPVERFLSQYYFHRTLRTAVQSGALNDPRVVGAVHLDLADYVDGPEELRVASSNVQALHYAWRYCDAPERLAEKDLIDAAIASLEGYDEIGVFTNMQAFVDNCCDRLGVPRQAVPHLNITMGRLPRERVSPAVLATLVSRNSADANPAEPASGSVFNAASSSGRNSVSHNGPRQAITSSTRFCAGAYSNFAIATCSRIELPGARRVLSSIHHGTGPSLSAIVQRFPLRTSANANDASCGPANLSVAPIVRR